MIDVTPPAHTEGAPFVKTRYDTYGPSSMAGVQLSATVDDVTPVTDSTGAVGACVSPDSVTVTALLTGDWLPAASTARRVKVYFWPAPSDRNVNVVAVWPIVVVPPDGQPVACSVYANEPELSVDGLHASDT